MCFRTKRSRYTSLKVRAFMYVHVYLTISDTAVSEVVFVALFPLEKNFGYTWNVIDR